jgi:hypothetical protein
MSNLRVGAGLVPAPFGRLRTEGTRPQPKEDLTAEITEAPRVFPVSSGVSAVNLLRPR